MGLDRAFDISISAVDAQRKHMEIISSNMANIESTRTVEGGPYRRKVPVFTENPISFSAQLDRAQKRIGGVRIAEVVDDPAPLQRVYNPGHPDADLNGYVTMPNVSLSKEMVDLVYASKLYEANITVLNAVKKMEQDTLQIQ